VKTKGKRRCHKARLCRHPLKVSTETRLPRLREQALQSGRNRRCSKDWRQEWRAKAGKVVAVRRVCGSVQEVEGEQAGLCQQREGLPRP